MILLLKLISPSRLFTHRKKKNLQKIIFFISFHFKSFFICLAFYWKGMCPCLLSYPPNPSWPFMKEYLGPESTMQEQAPRIGTLYRCREREHYKQSGIQVANVKLEFEIDKGVFISLDVLRGEKFILKQCPYNWTIQLVRIPTFFP